MPACGVYYIEGLLSVKGHSKAAPCSHRLLRCSLMQLLPVSICAQISESGHNCGSALAARLIPRPLALLRSWPATRKPKAAGGRWETRLAARKGFLMRRVRARAVQLMFGAGCPYGAQPIRFATSPGKVAKHATTRPKAIDEMDAFRSGGRPGFGPNSGAVHPGPRSHAR
jgi:hypothetical protein